MAHAHAAKVEQAMVCRDTGNPLQEQLLLLSCIAHLAIGLFNAPEDHSLHTVRLLGHVLHVLAEACVWVLLLSLEANAALDSLLLKAVTSIAETNL